jgi:hypothetical protein
MDVKTIINPSVRAIRVVDLQKGSVYKRVVKEYSDNYKVKFGVVLDIMNGEETFIQVVEVTQTYGTPKLEFDIIGAESDLNIYPTTKEELAGAFGNVEENANRQLEQKREELAKEEKALETFKELVSSNFAKITDTSFVPLQSGEIVETK